MKDDQLPVPSSLDIHLDQIHDDAEGRGNGGQRVAGRGMAGGAAVTDAKEGNRGHDAIMNDSDPRGAELAGSPAAPPLARVERWYVDHCRPISEVCIVSFPRDGSAHRHAVLVPDFAHLKERRQPNSREVIRFEFQAASKRLAPAERPHTFSVRARPLPRTANGEPDRERLRIELSAVAVRHTSVPDTEIDPVRNTIYKLIRGYRPAAHLRENANLELDLDFDSLDRVLLLCSVEKAFGIAIPPAQAAQIFTAGELLDAVAGSMRRPEPLASAPSLGPSPALSSWAEILSRPLNPQERGRADLILKPRSALSFLAWGCAYVLRIALQRRFHFQVKGREHLAVQGPCVLVANHCSHLDPLFLLWALPFQVARRVSFMGHTEYFGSGWKASVAARLKLVPVDPDEHALEGMKLCAEALRRGFTGAIFPEGERSPNGAQQCFHRGTALLAMRLQLPIVPVAIAGTYEVLPRGRDQIRPAPVQVSFGAPLHVQPGETEQDLLARVWAAVWRLRGADARDREPMPRPQDVYTESFL